MKIRLSHILPASLMCGFLVELSGCGTNETLKSGGGSGGSDAGRILGAGGRAQDGAVHSSGGAGATTSLGKKCLDDSECKAPYICLESTGNDVGPGGPPRGICTLDCTGNVPVCRQNDPGSICVSFPSNVSYCLPGCSPGVAQDPTENCLGRRELACEPSDVDPTQGYCRPLCASDLDCGSRKCDIGSGFCVDKPSGTLPVGSQCDPNATVDPCEGFCVGSTDLSDADLPKYGFCSGRCYFGSFVESCGNDPSSAAADALCTFLITSTPGVGDVALCGQACDCNEDCRNKNLICDVFNDSQLAQTAGHAGVCTLPFDSNMKRVPGTPCKPTTGTGGQTGTGGKPAADAGKPLQDARVGD